ncbi:SEC-C metal-binding domain-containing protein, partial [Bacteroides fragilis]
MVSVLIPKGGFTGLIAQKTGRNKVCPCGSGKKAKKCCGADTKYYSRQPCDSE